MVRTYGLTHLAIAVRDPDRSLDFYRTVFGVREYYRDDEMIQVQGPGPHDVLAFVRKPDAAGSAGGVIHFGFRLTSPEDIGIAVDNVERAGGIVKSQGEFAAGVPYAFVLDPDGYEIEIWYE